MAIRFPPSIESSDCRDCSIVPDAACMRMRLITLPTEAFWSVRPALT